MGGPRGTLEQRLLLRSHQDGPHRVWDGAYRADGRPGDIRDGGHLIGAERAAYTLCVGEIPDGHVVRATCGVAGCIAPAHIEIRPHQAYLREPRKDVCKYGHSLADAYFSGGKRRCRTCHQLRSKGRRRDQRVQKTDALDGTPIPRGEGETVRVGLDGERFLLLLTAEHAAELRTVLAPYIAAAKPATTPKPPRISPDTESTPTPTGQPRTPTHIQCLVCGRWLRSMSTHLARAHDMTAEEYKLAHGLLMKEPLAAVDLVPERATGANAERKAREAGYASMGDAIAQTAGLSSREAATLIGVSHPTVQLYRRKNDT